MLKPSKAETYIRNNSNKIDWICKCNIKISQRNITTVELRWLELEGTVKMCSSYRKFEPPNSVISERKQSDSDPEVSLRNDGLMHSAVGLCRKTIFNPLRKYTKTTASEYLWYLQTFLWNVFSLCSLLELIFWKECIISYIR